LWCRHTAIICSDWHWLLALWSFAFWPPVFWPLIAESADSCRSSKTGSATRRCSIGRVSTHLNDNTSTQQLVISVPFSDENGRWNESIQIFTLTAGAAFRLPPVGPRHLLPATAHGPERGVPIALHRQRAGSHRHFGSVDRATPCQGPSDYRNPNRVAA